MSLTSSMNIAKAALSVNQTAITTISNNIANADTPGYSKLRVNLSEVVNYQPVNGGPVSIANSLSGVDVSQIQRYSDIYLQSYAWQENSNYTYLEQYSKSSSTLENLVNELNDTGLASALTNFYDAADSLSDTPSDLTARQNYVAAAESLCSVFNGISSNLSYMQESLVGTPLTTSPSELDDNIVALNDLFDQLADVNESIVKTNLGGISSTTLLDKRDALVSEISNYIPVNANPNKNGTMNIYLGNIALVSSSEVTGYLSAVNSVDASDNLVTTLSVIDANGTTKYPDVNYLADAGQIGAILDISGTDTTKLTLKGVMDSINKMASEFAETMNNIQLNVNASGTPLSINSATMTLEAADEPMFTTKTGTGTINAANITVNAAIVSNPYEIAAARTDTSSSTYSNLAVGNNSNMTLVMSARTTKNSDLDNMTLEGYLSSMVSKVGTSVENIESGMKTQKSVLSAIESKLSSEVGVNLDEELADLMKYQRAYEAASRIFSVCNELMGDLVNLGR